MDDSERNDAPRPVAPEAIAETHPPTTHEPPEVHNEPVEVKEDTRSLPGWPRVRFHPVHGRREFADPYEAAKFGQDDDRGDWRFKSAAEADAARTDTEAGEVIAQNMRTKLAEHDEAERPVARNSASAQESIDSGHFEPL